MNEIDKKAEEIRKKWGVNEDDPFRQREKINRKQRCKICGNNCDNIINGLCEVDNGEDPSVQCQKCLGRRLIFEHSKCIPFGSFEDENGTFREHYNCNHVDDDGYTLI